MRGPPPGIILTVIPTARKLLITVNLSQSDGYRGVGWVRSIFTPGIVDLNVVVGHLRRWVVFARI